MNNNFEKYHWKFFVDDGQTQVYEQRDGDVIGCIPFDIDYIKDYIKDFTEDQVYQFIESTIEWY